MKLNKIKNINFLENEIPDNSADLIIADPPYFEVKGEFDFIWGSFDEYLKDVEKWAAECRRILSENGTLIWYGSANRVAYSQIILDKYFNLLNNAVWNKGAFLSLEKSKELRKLAPCTERILIYSLDSLNLTGCVYHLRDYIRGEIVKAKGKIVFKEINQALGTATNGGGVASACLSLDKTEPSMITREMYEKLQKWCAPYLSKHYNQLRAEYEELRAEYEAARRPFNNEFELNEVLNFSNESGKVGAKYDHETVKPETLTRALILTMSRPGDLVVVPFCGSGTECAMAAKEGRNFLGFDINSKYVKTASERVDRFIKQKTLF